MDNKKQFFSRPAGLLSLFAILIGCILLAVRIGSASLPSAEFWGGLFRGKEYHTQTLILYQIRLPRIAGALLAGAGLSVSGVLLQAVTGNELAAPNIIGVNAGAGFAVIVLLSLAPSAALFSPVAAFCGAFLATSLILTIAAKAGHSKTSVILTGIAVTAMLNAGISFLSLLDTDVLASYNYFSMGGLSGIQGKELILPACIILAGIVAAMFLSQRIDTLCLGDSVAAALGINVHLLRTVCMVAASACAAAVVSFAGLLGFVGLIVPHMARRLVGGTLRSLIPVSVLLGGILVVLADLLGRVAVAPSEVPVGIVMSLIGAPFFFWLLLRRKRNAEI